MIKLTDIAESIENGLNVLLANSGVSFKVWVDAGDYQKALRTGNTVDYFINANLRSVSSANEGNILVMGANGLMLDFVVPNQIPKTFSTQSPDVLEKIQNGQFSFPQHIRDVVDTYFQISKASTADYVEDDISYKYSVDAGRAQTGVTDILPVIGECTAYSVFISVTFLQGGINARDVVLSIDGVQVPLQNVTIARANRLSSDVYAGDIVVKNLTSATALSIDFAFPANADNSTKQAFAAVLEGKPNIAHFVKLALGTEFDGEYLMTFDNMQINAQTILFAGIAGTLIEVVQNMLLLDVPDYMQVGRFALSSSATEELTFIATGTAFIAGQVRDLDGSVTVQLSPSDFAYDEENDTYYVYMISLATMPVSEASATFTVVKEASQNG